MSDQLPNDIGATFLVIVLICACVGIPLGLLLGWLS